jgi:hypothetical protein
MIVDVHVKNLRAMGYENLQQWMENEQNFYCGRKGVVFINNIRFPKQDSRFHNPYKVGKDGNLEEVLQKFYQYALANFSYQELLPLQHKNLGCWCVNATTLQLPFSCHTQVLLYIIANGATLIQQGLLRY